MRGWWPFTFLVKVEMMKKGIDELFVSSTGATFSDARARPFHGLSSQRGVDKQFVSCGLLDRIFMQDFLTYGLDLVACRSLRFLFFPSCQLCPLPPSYSTLINILRSSLRACVSPKTCAPAYHWKKSTCSCCTDSGHTRALRARNGHDAQWAIPG